MLSPCLRSHYFIYKMYRWYTYLTMAYWLIRDKVPADQSSTVFVNISPCVMFVYFLIRFIICIASVLTSRIRRLRKTNIPLNEIRCWRNFGFWLVSFHLLSVDAYFILFKKKRLRFGLWFFGSLYRNVKPETINPFCS